MTKKVTVVAGSIRPNSVGVSLLPRVKSLLEACDIEVQVADLKELALPFFDMPMSPADDSYAPDSPSFKTWQKLIVESDGVVMITPEYNHHISAVQKNAIDWLYKEWEDKPIAAICYGWSGGEMSFKMFEVLMKKVKANLVKNSAHLYFTKDISTTGEILEESTFDDKVTTAIKTLKEAL